MSDEYQPRHAAEWDPVSVYEATFQSEGYSPRHARTAEPRFVVVHSTGHGVTHGTYRPDVRLFPVVVPG